MSPCDQGYVWKVGDTGPTNTTTLVDRDGTGANLAGATVRFLMRPEHSDTLKIDGQASIEDAAGGLVHYVREAGDTDTPGTFLAEYEATYSDGSTQTFPEDGYIPVRIREDLD